MPGFVLLTHVLLGFTVRQVPAQTPTPAPTTAPAPAPEATPTLTLGDKLTRVLPDRHVTFRLLAPDANAVDVVVGIKSRPYEPQRSTTAKMTKDANRLWRVTFGPF